MLFCMHSEFYHNVTQDPLQEWVKRIRILAEKITPPILSEKVSKAHRLHTQAGAQPNANNKIVARSSTCLWPWP